MKKFLIGFTTCLLITAPLLVFSAPNLAERLKGKILLAVEDKGKTYYVHSDGNRYQITVATAQKIFEKLALGITNSDLEQIPMNDVGIDPETKNSTCEPEKIYIESDATCEPEKIYIEKTYYKETIINQCEESSEEESTAPTGYSSYSPRISSHRDTSNYAGDVFVVKLENPTSRDIRIKKMKVHIPYNFSGPIYFSIGEPKKDELEKNVLDKIENNDFIYFANEVSVQPPTEIYFYGNEKIETDFSDWEIWDYTENKQINQYN